MAALKICRNCGNQTYGRYPGSSIITLLLLCMFILPGLIYSQWRGSKGRCVCPKCKSSSLVPIDSPLAAQLMQPVVPSAMPPASPQPGQVTPSQPVPSQPVYIPTARSTNEMHPMMRYVVWGLGILLLVLIAKGQKTTPGAVSSASYVDPVVTTVDKANAACTAFNGTGLVSACQVEVLKHMITVSIDTTGKEANKICHNSSQQMRDAGYNLGSDWRLQVVSPFTGDRPLATCNL